MDQRARVRIGGKNMLMLLSIWMTAVSALIGLRHWAIDGGVSCSNHSCLMMWAIPAPVKAMPSSIRVVRRGLRVVSGAFNAGLLVCG